MKKHFADLIAISLASKVLETNSANMLSSRALEGQAIENASYLADFIKELSRRLEEDTSDAIDSNLLDKLIKKD